MSQWISVKDRLPKPDDVVICYLENGYAECGKCCVGSFKPMEGDPAGENNFWGLTTPASEWTLYGWSYFHKPIVTHWMPLPEAPEELGHEKNTREVGRTQRS